MLFIHIISTDTVRIFKRVDDFVNNETISLSALSLIINQLNPAKFVLCGTSSVSDYYDNIPCTIIPDNTPERLDALRHYIYQTATKANTLSSTDIRSLLIHSNALELFQLATSGKTIDHANPIVQEAHNKSLNVFYSDLGVLFTIDGFPVTLPAVSGSIAEHASNIKDNIGLKFTTLTSSTRFRNLVKEQKHICEMLFSQ